MSSFQISPKRDFAKLMSVFLACCLNASLTFDSLVLSQKKTERVAKDHYFDIRERETFLTLATMKRRERH